MRESTDEKWVSWYQSFDEKYGSEQRQEWYSEAATAYRWARPQYPDALIEKVWQQANLSPQSSMLEIGCGPGIATAAFAAKGLSIVAVEPSSAACELARKSCRESDAANTPNTKRPSQRVTVINSTFEDFSLAHQKFDAVLAATSFHWIPPEIACQKSAAALKPNGSLILLWATPLQPSEEICQYLSCVYEQYGLSALGKEQHRTQAHYQSSFEIFAKAVNESGCFQTTSVDMQKHQSIYSIEKYLALLSTLSHYIALEEQLRNDLFIAIGERLAEKLETGALTTTHWFANQVAPLKI